MKNAESPAFEIATAEFHQALRTNDRGNYMQLWKSDADGQWRFEREIWNSTAPVSPPE